MIGLENALILDWKVSHMVPGKDVRLELPENDPPGFRADPTQHFQHETLHYICIYNSLGPFDSIHPLSLPDYKERCTIILISSPTPHQVVDSIHYFARC